MSKTNTNEFVIAALGASAGGLEAFENFFKHMPLTLRAQKSTRKATSETSVSSVLINLEEALMLPPAPQMLAAPVRVCAAADSTTGGRARKRFRRKLGARKSRQ